MHNAFVEVFCFVVLVFGHLAITSGFLPVFISLFLEGVFWFASFVPAEFKVVVRFGVYAFGENV